MLNRLREQKEAARHQREVEKISHDLQDAAEKGEWDVVTQMVHLYGKDGDIINAPRLTDNGMPAATALYLAAQKGHLETVNALLRAPSIKLNDMNFGDDLSTALLAAAKFGHAKVVMALAAQPKINPNLKGGMGVCPLTYAVYHCPEAIPVLLAANNIDVNNIDSDKRTPLAHAVLSPTAPRDTLPEAVELLLKAENIDVDAHDHRGWTPLMHAAKKGSLPIAQALLAAGANHAKQNFEAKTAEQIAVQFKHDDIAAVLKAHAESKVEVKDAVAGGQPDAQAVAKNFKTRSAGKSFLEFFRQSKPVVEDVDLDVEMSSRVRLPTINK